MVDKQEDAVPTPTKVTFALPQDITTELMNFESDNNNNGNNTNGGRRASSLELRRDIPTTLLFNHVAIADDMQKPNDDDDDATAALGCFRRSFLNPRYPLRRQMMLTFGSVSSLTILLVVMVSIAASNWTGDAIKEESNDNVEEWVGEFTSTTSRFVAEAIAPKIMLTDLVDLLVEVGKDRFAGYPTTTDDSKTPFFDTQNQKYSYPLRNKPLPLDWDYSHTPNAGGNVNASNAAEHVQDRWPWYSSTRLSTAIAMYTMQGACNPSATAEGTSALGYYPNCTDDNNDFSTGGVVAPTRTNEQIHRKAADLSPFLKALYESNRDLYNIGYYFGNSGAGSSIVFPHYELDSSSSYDSVGCDWMRKPNPIDESLGPIGTEEEIARCHPEGAEVGSREYNPLTRGWCRDQALQPDRVRTVGPFVNPWAAKKFWLLSTGRAVYDLVTNEFVSCISVDIAMDGLNKMLNETKVDGLGTITLVRNDENGTVVTTPKFDFDTADSLTTIDDPMLETGIDLKMFDEIKSKVDYAQAWDPKSASEAYMDTFTDIDGSNIISAYPIPPVPEEYDPTYEPEFFAIFSLPKAERLDPIIDTVYQKVDESVRDTVIFAVGVGIAGLVVSILLIFATSSWFTEPLNWMHRVGEQVVGKFGEDLDTGIDYERKEEKCAPKTEFSSLVEEFKKMIARFSGEGTAKRMQKDDIEKMNLFDLSEDFAALYRSRADSAFAYNYPESSSAPAASSGGNSIDQQRHLGPNTGLALKSESSSKSLLGTDTVNTSGKIYKSPLFLWMVVLIVTPTLMTTIIISAVVLGNISVEFPSMIEPIQKEYLALREDYRVTKTEILAVRASGVSERAARDTFLLTRFAHWLYFGGMETAPDSFTELVEVCEECKTASPASECEWASNLPCDCAWNDFFVRENGHACTISCPEQSRLQQKVLFACQSQDAKPDGSRDSTSFPDVAKFPNTTAWWDNTTVLPRSAKESATSTYGTTWDRTRILSALSTVFLPLYNYDKSNAKPLALSIGFEADGMMAGYRGCNSGFLHYPFWRSTKENGAALMRNETCPLHKYGYDPRCRGWYHVGKEKAEAGNGTFHITPPYFFAEGDVVGQSASMPLIDPQNNEHLGQVLLDFRSPTSKLLESDNTKLAAGGFSIMITTESDVLNHDTIVAPQYSLKDGGKSIKDLLLPDGSFDAILQDMKSGGRGTVFFSRTNRGSVEWINMTYSPVNVMSNRPLDGSDITRGVVSETNLVYSLALAETTEGILGPFKSIEDSSSMRVDIFIVVLSALILFSTMLIIYMAFHVATSMVGPILHLLEVIKDINCTRLSNDDVTKLTDYEASCREVDSVYKTIEMLYKVVQFANSAFFSGDLEVAYQVLKNALRLFARLDNKKAIAIASNNLGNTMLTIYRTMEKDGSEEMCGLSKTEVISKGNAYFAQAIKLGETAYDQFYNEQGWSEECLVFMQFLANRYFNRAIFLLTTSSDSKNRNDAVAMGFRDLQITGDMDIEIVDQCLEMGFKINRVERFELMMSRIRGLLALNQLGYSPEELFIDDQIKDMYQDLKNAMKNPSHDLFKEISVAGRMQKLDTVLMKYLSQAKDDNINAARVAIRMLIEDEYVFPDAEEEAMKTLLVYMNTTEDENCPKDENGNIVKELESAIESLDEEFVQSVHRSSQNSAGNMDAMSSSSMRSLNMSTLSGSNLGNVSTKSVGVNVALSKEDSKRRSLAVKESHREDVTMEFY